MLRLLIVGSGGREHALAWKLAQSPRVGKLYTAPGNAGTASLGENLPIPATDLPALARAAREKGIDLTVVGPEAPLAQGIVDLFQGQGLPIFGPTRAATEIESSKVFAKQLMEKYGIPCARGAVFSSCTEAKDYVRGHPLPLVVKADGLAAGKGVTVAHTREEALEALSQAMERRAFGAAGDRVIIEECLEGKEVSLLALTDGQRVLPLAPACDYKRAQDGDRGPNTGGMGGYCPPRSFGKALVQRAARTILEPAVRAMAAEGRPYRGVLYAGLMVTAEGPKALEFNARFGDPETQVILPRLKTDLVEALLAVLNGTLDRMRLQWSPQACVGVVLASGGYPGSYRTGLPVTGWECLDKDTLVFHAGTRPGGKAGEVLTDGGRVFTVAALGRTLAQAQAKAYLNVPCLRFEGCFYRGDIAAREVG